MAEVLYEIKSNNVLGRYLTASRDILPGEVIIEKAPLLIGPKMVSVPVCLNCNRKLPKNESWYSCRSCKWPMCDETCQESRLHKTECKILSKSVFHPQNVPAKQSIYATIVPLRALLLNTEDSNTLNECQNHLLEHSATKLYQILKTNLVPLFLRDFKLDNNSESNEEQILKICSILDTNCFQVRAEDGAIDVRGLYPIMSLLAHDCQHNTRHYFTPESMKIVLEASTVIKKGEIISTTYTQTLWGTLERRAHLMMAKQFECLCQRCRDPTELGLYIGSIFCPACKENKPEMNDSSPKLVSVDPTNKTSNWRCEKCNYQLSSEEMHFTNTFFREMITKVDKDSPNEFEDILSMYNHVLHANNSFALEIKYALTQIYGNCHSKRYSLSVLPLKLVERKIDLLRELLEVGAILEPGQSRFRGGLLNALQEILVWKVQIQLERGDILKKDAKGILMETLKMYEEAGKILNFNNDKLEETRQIRLNLCAF